VRLDRTACAGTISVLFVLAILFASFPTVSAEKFSTVSAENLQTDYVQYRLKVVVENISTIIEGEVRDSEFGTSVGGASVSGEVHSEDIPVNVQTDVNGHFRVVLPKNLTDENHTFILNISADNYDIKQISDTFKKGDTKYVRVLLDYNPFGLSLSENSGGLTRGWNAYTQSQTYKYRMSTDFPGFKSNVTQLGGYNDYFATASRSTSGSGYNFTYYDPFRNQNVTFYSSYFDAHDYSTMVQVTDRWFYTDGGTFIDHDSNGNSVWTNQFYQNYTASNGSEIALDSAFRNINYLPHIIHTDSHYETRAYGYLTTGGVRIRRYATPYWLNFHSRSDLGSGVVAPKQNFTITYSEYVNLDSIPYYHNNGSFIRTDTTDYSSAPWENVQTTLTATPRNGYTGNVKLVVENDNGIDAILGSSTLTFASPASTTLTLKPKDNTHGSLHFAKIYAYDSNNRLVFGTASKPTPTYDLSLTTPSKPAQLIVQYLLSSGTSYISVGVNSLYTGALQGASVELRYSNGALLASGATGSNGVVTFTPSPWPLNTNLTVTASYPGYYSPGGSVTPSINTGEGGTKSATVQLSKGDFYMAGVQSGLAYVYPDGKSTTAQKGKVQAGPAWLGNQYPYLPINGWLGGGVSLSGQLDSTYFSSFSFGRNYMQPSSIDEVTVEATPKQVVTTSCAVRVFGTAGAPTNYQRNADIGYAVEPRQQP